ncbi:MAG: cyclase family protein [Microthrixaceae bacterium]
MLHGGLSAEDSQRSSSWSQACTRSPIVSRGLLLDVATIGGDATEATGHLPGGYEITVEDLERTLEHQQLEIRRGDTVLIRSGWGSLFDQGPAYVGADSGVPGVSEAGAEWLAAAEPTAVGADTIAFEMLAPGNGHASLPAHRVLLVEAGIPIIETLDLEGPARAGVHEFMFVLAHLNIVGATGAPARPLAIVAAQ